MRREAKMILFLSDARGQYIPRDFAQSINRNRIKGVPMEDLNYLARGPHDLPADEECPLAHDAEYYWDTWNDVCNNAVITDDDGTEYFVYQDCDCWLVERGAIWNDEENRDDSIDTMFYMDDGEEKET